MLQADDKHLRCLAESLQKQVQQLEFENTDLEATLFRLQSNVDVELDRLRDHMASLMHRVKLLMKSRPTPAPATGSKYTAFACTGNITLSCPGERRISVTVGGYAKYANSACSRCRCPPNPALDCTEVIEENNPKVWYDIKTSCDYRKSCDVRPNRTAINQCKTNYIPDYIQVFYDCLPDDVNGPVGFAAYANTGKRFMYNFNDVIVFDEVISNFGGHYNPETSSFVCPADGVYMIGVHVLARKSYDVIANIMRNYDELVAVRIDSLERHYNANSGTIVAHGSRGDVIWIRQGYNATARIYAADRRNFFACFLLYRF